MKKRFNIELTLMFMPTLILILLYKLIPSLVALIAFKKLNNLDGILKSDWVGLENFRFLINSLQFKRIFSNTIIYNSTFIILTTIISLILAYNIYKLKEKYFVSIILSIILIPCLFSWVTVSYITKVFLDYNGIINRFLLFLGKSNKNFYLMRSIWFPFLTIVYIWKNIGYYVLIFYTAMVNIKKEYIFLSIIDGVNSVQQFFFIILPLIKRIVLIILFFWIADILFSDFGLFYNIPRNTGYLYPVTDVIDTYIFRALKNGDFEISIASSLIQSLLGLFMTVIFITIINNINKADE